MQIKYQKELWFWVHRGEKRVRSKKEKVLDMTIDDC